MPHKFYVGVKAVIVASNKALLLQKPDFEGKLYWDLPGGRMDEGETFIDALNRELKEELPSLKEYRIQDLLHVFKLEQNLKDGTGLILMIYKVSATDFEVVHSDEHSAMAWVSIDQIEQLNSDKCYISNDNFRAVELALKDN
ncbi:MAG: NUDIX domain-containing protein [Patescibacteria group bacterium]